MSIEWQLLSTIRDMLLGAGLDCAMIYHEFSGTRPLVFYVYDRHEDPYSGRRGLIGIDDRGLFCNESGARIVDRQYYDLADPQGIDAVVERAKTWMTTING